MRIFEDIEYKKDLFIDLHLPDDKNFPLLIYFHGGSLSSGDRKIAKSFAHTLAKNGIGVASVEYRMYPNAKFPDFIEDCADAVAWCKTHANEYGNCEKTYVGGSSAGGYLSMMLCFDPTYLKKRNLSPLDIDGFIHDAGQPTSHFNVLRERGCDPRRVIVDETAPVFFVGTEETYPPMLFIVSDHDLEGRYEQTKMIVKTLEHFGHTEKVFYKEMHGNHCEYVSASDSQGEGIFGNIVLEFIKAL